MGARPPLVLSMGEPAGVGPELAAQAWARRRADAIPPFAYLGDIADLQRRLDHTGFAVPLRAVDIGETMRVFDDVLPVIDIALHRASIPGKPDEANAGAVIQAISMGVSLCLNGQASGLITNPVQKSALHAAGFGHAGHTEFLGLLAREAGYSAAKPVMMLACDSLRVIPVTVHCPLRDVPDLLTTQLIIDIANVAARDLRAHYAIKTPRLAVAGLNPHAGEEGMLGREDMEIIAPAIERLRADGIAAHGPLPADTMFHAKARETYDVALAMYHDQALIAIKTLAFDHAVNTTLGLPFLRTSPDHGTALALAGSGQADARSLIAAIKLAGQLADGRAEQSRSA